MLGELQLLLFVDLPIPDPASPRQRARRKRLQLFGRLWRQMELKLVPRRQPRPAAEPDSDTEYDYPVHRIACAASLPAPTFSAPRSVFDLASFGLASGITQCQPAQIHRRVIREDGVTRHVAMRYQETDEWAERERARRAKQRPPRPPKGAKTMSGKLRELVGVDG